MTRNHNHDNASSSSTRERKKKKKKNRFKTFVKDSVAPWSDINHDVLFLVMMKLRVVDFVAFSEVCKSWRSFAIFNKKIFMASIAPMWTFIRHYVDNSNTMACCMKDFDGRKLRNIVPHSAGRICVGYTCGYLILIGKETQDFWLVNPIKKHGIYFPCFSLYLGSRLEIHEYVRGLLVFSTSISGWVFVMLHNNQWREGSISFYIAGKREWNHVSSTLSIIDIHVFKGKIYTLDTDLCIRKLKLLPNRKRKWKLLEPKNFPQPKMFSPEFVSSGESLYLIDTYAPHKVLELDIGKMKWVSLEKTICILDIHVFKGEIHTLDTDLCIRKLKLLPNGNRKWMLLETKNFPKLKMYSPELVSTGKSLYVRERHGPYNVPELHINIDEMKWVSPENTIGEYVFFLCSDGMRSSAAIKPESWTRPPTQYKSYDCFLDTDENLLDITDYNSLWYFPHDCLSVNYLR